MREVTGAVIATSLVLIAVFVPVAFFPGTTGRLYKQFSLTIAFSVAISAFNSLTLSPALAALLLRAEREQHVAALPRVQPRPSTATRARYRRALGWLLRHLGWAGAGLRRRPGASRCWIVPRVPTGFVPDEDQDYFIVQLHRPAGRVARLHDRRRQAGGGAAQAPRRDRSTSSRSRASASPAAAPTAAIIFASLKPLGERAGREHSAQAVVGGCSGRWARIPGALVVPFLPPSIQGLGSTGGFPFELLDQGSGTDFSALAEASQASTAEATQQRARARPLLDLHRRRSAARVTIDREKAKSLGVPLEQIVDTLGVYLGSDYVNDFDFNTRAYRVYVQAASRLPRPAARHRRVLRPVAGRARWCRSTTWCA